MSDKSSVRRCVRCIMPSSRPRIVFDEEGVCNACRNAERKHEIDWDGRRLEFIELANRMKQHSAYDCIVPFSGGKDSAVVAYKMRELGLRPLLVTFGQMMWTDVGRRNFHRIADAGFEINYWRVDQQVSRNLARRFFIERGHPKAHYDAAVNAVPLLTALAFYIPLVVFAEHGESEYGGLVRNPEATQVRDRAEVLEHQVGDDARNWVGDGLTERDLFPYIYPAENRLAAYGVKAVYASYYFRWNVYKNAAFAKDRFGFEQAQNGVAANLPQRWWGKSDGSFEGFDSIDDKIDDLDYYMMYVKFGFGRATRMACRMLQSGHMARDTALDLACRYDGEFPHTYIDDIARYLGMSVTEIIETSDRHRNAEIWRRKSNGDWVLKLPAREET